jgi:GNAT superfamily N-acetyltransferase
MKFVVAIAEADSDATAIAALRNAVADHLTREHGRGHWSLQTTEKGVRRGIATSRVLVARSAAGIIGTLRLVTKKPWAIDPSYFVSVRRPIYLLDMAVAPDQQRQGIGRRLCAAAAEAVRNWPGDAIRLDAYDAPAGAGEFYAKCGFREVGRAAYRGVPLVYFEKVLDNQVPGY